MEGALVKGSAKGAVAATARAAPKRPMTKARILPLPILVLSFISSAIPSAPHRGEQPCYSGVTRQGKSAIIFKLDSSSMPRKKFPANVVGSQIRKARYQLGLTQEKFAARCQ